MRLVDVGSGRKPFSRRASAALVAAAAAASLAFVASPPAAAADGGTTAASLTLPIEGVVSTTAGRRVYVEISLRRGVDWEPAVRAWQLGGPADVTLVLYDAYGMPHSEIHLENAWPSGLGDSLGGDEPELSIATLTVVCDGIRRVDP